MTAAPEVGDGRQAQDPALGAAVVPHISLRGTRLLELRCAFQSPATIPEPPYSNAVETSFAWSRREDGLAFAFKVDIKAAPQNAVEHPFWTCSVVYEVTYAAEDPARFNDEQVQAFGRSSGLLAAWPYLRETIHAVSAKSGLAPILLDVVRFSLIDQAMQ